MKIKIKQNIKLSKSRRFAQRSVSKVEEYWVVGICDERFRVIDDDGEPVLKPKDIFEIVDSSIPKDWVKRKYKDGEYHIDPKFAAKAGFYEDLFDGKKYAVKAFHDFVMKNGYMSKEDWEQKWTKGRLVK